MPVNFPLAIKAVMIDLDGTLLDTIPDLAAAANMMLRELERAELPESLIRTFVGKGITNLVQRTLAGSLEGEIEPASLARGLAIFERCYAEVNGKHTTIYPGVETGLALFRAQGFRLACVTNKSTRYTLPLLEMVGLAVHFEQVVAGDTLRQKKPDAAPLLHACEVFGIAPADMLMIGDSINDTQSARAAGCPVFCVPYGYNEGLDVRSLDTDAVVETLEDAAGLVRKI